MRVEVLTTLLTALPSALAWQITVYREEDCSDNGGAFDYVSSFLFGLWLFLGYLGILTNK